MNCEKANGLDETLGGLLVTGTLRDRRKELGKSLDDVSLETGFNVGTLSQYERGLIVPKPENAERLQKGYNLPAEVIRFMCKQARDRRIASKGA